AVHPLVEHVGEPQGVAVPPESLGEAQAVDQRLQAPHRGAAYARGAAGTEGGIWMRNGFKVFDADAHVIYPADLWPRYLDKKFVDRVERRPPPGFDHYSPNMVDGRYTQHPTSMYGDFQKAIGWTTEDMHAQYGELMTKGFTGDLVAEALKVEGV